MKKIKKIEGFEKGTTWIDIRDLADSAVEIIDKPKEIIDKINEIIDKLNE